jgi:predicted transcriptional regulator
MTTQTVTVRLPGPLYVRLQHLAEQARRTVEAEIVEMVAAAVPVGDELPPDLEARIAQLATMGDDDLRVMARTHFPATNARALAALNSKQQREGLTDQEVAAQTELVRQYESAMLLRARAAALLKQRGHDVSGLLATKV